MCRKINFDLKCDFTPLAEASAGVIKAVTQWVNALFVPYCAKQEAKKLQIEGKSQLQQAQNTVFVQDILARKKELDENGNLKTIAPPSNLDVYTAHYKEYTQAVDAKNVQMVIIEAIKQVEEEKLTEDQISDEPINPTFFNRWRKEAESIGDDEFRKWWAHLLVEETKKHNSISPRTLDVAKNITQQEAILFSSLQSEILDNCLVDLRKGKEIGDLLRLQDAGLIGNLASKQLNCDTILANGEKTSSILLLKSKLVILSHSNLSLGAYPLTLAGLELSNIDPFTHNLDSLKELLQKISQLYENADFTIHQIYSKIDEKTINYEPTPLWSSKAKNIK